jgi:hypothetical protein
MTGTATLVQNNAGQFDYREHGQFRLPDGRTLGAECRYIFALEDDGFTVLFAETTPRLFHRIVLQRSGSTLAGNGTHVCGNDLYDSRYEFCADDTFTIRHAVTGPRKRYTIATRYSRVAITAPPA